jgi:hypothetical protein
LVDRRSSFVIGCYKAFAVGRESRTTSDNRPTTVP